MAFYSFGYYVVKLSVAVLNYYGECRHTDFHFVMLSVLCNVVLIVSLQLVIMLCCVSLKYADCNYAEYRSTMLSVVILC